MQERPKRTSVSEPSGRTRKKRNLTEVERSQISQFHLEHPLVTHNNIACKSMKVRATMIWQHTDEELAIFGVERRYSRSSN